MGYTLDSLSWCCQLLPCSDGEKSGSLMTNSWSFTVAATKNVQSNHIYMSVGIVGLSHVEARQCTSTVNWVFGSWDAWFRVPMSLSADMMNIFYQWTTLSSPLIQSRGLTLGWAAVKCLLLGWVTLCGQHHLTNHQRQLSVLSVWCR